MSNEGNKKKIAALEDTIKIACKCGNNRIDEYFRKINGKFVLLPAELICTGCGNIIKVKDFINA